MRRDQQCTLRPGPQGFRLSRIPGARPGGPRWRGMGALVLVAVAALAALPAAAQSATSAEPQAKAPESRDDVMRRTIREANALRFKGEVAAAFDLLERSCRELPVAAWGYLFQEARARLYPRDRAEFDHFMRVIEALDDDAIPADAPEEDRRTARTALHQTRGMLLEYTRENAAAATEYRAAAALATEAARTALLEKAVRLYLAADLPDQAQETVREGPPPRRYPERVAALAGLIALYRGDLDQAAQCYASGSSTMESHCRHLLDFGRHAEAAWLAERLPAQAPGRRRILGLAYFEQRRFGDALAVLDPLLEDEATPEVYWREAAAQIVQIHAAAATLETAIETQTLSLEMLPANAEERRSRGLYLLAALHEKNQDHLAAVHAVIDRAETEAGGFRQRATPLLPGLNDLRKASAGLIAEERFAEQAELLEAVRRLFPAVLELNPMPNGDYLYALLRLARQADAERLVDEWCREMTEAPRHAGRFLASLVVDRHSVPIAGRLLATAEALPEPDAMLRSLILGLHLRMAAARGEYARVGELLGQAEAALSQTQRSDVRRRLAERRVRMLAAAADGDEDLLLAILTSPARDAALAAADELARHGSLGVVTVLEALPPETPADVRDAGAAAAAAIRHRLGLAEPCPGQRDRERVLALVLPLFTPRRLWYDPETEEAAWVLAEGDGIHRVEVATGAVIPLRRLTRRFPGRQPTDGQVVFLAGMVWLGTDAGLYVVRPGRSPCDRLRVPGCPADAPVTRLAVAPGGQLAVTGSHADGASLQAVFCPWTWQWRAP